MRTLKPLITSRDIRFTVTSALPSHQVDGKLVDLAEDPDSGRKIYPDLGFDSHDGFDSVPGFSGVQYNGNTLPGSATVSESVDLFETEANITTLVQPPLGNISAFASF